MANVLRKQADSWNKPAESGGRGGARVHDGYVAGLRVVDVYPQGQVQPGAEFLRTAVRGIPFVVRYRRSTVVRAVPPTALSLLAMPDTFERTELVHACAICGGPAPLPADGGLQLSVIDKDRHVMGWAVHPACLANVLSPFSRSAFTQRFSQD